MSDKKGEKYKRFISFKIFSLIVASNENRLSQDRRFFHGHRYAAGRLTPCPTPHG
jgi:hypothetical protein